MTLYSQSRISKQDGEILKGNDYDSKIKCIVMVYNLFQPLFLHILTNKFHSYDFKCGTSINIWFKLACNAL